MTNMTNILLATNMSMVQRTLLIIGSIVVIGTLIYLLIIWYMKTSKADKKNKMLTMNLVIKYRLFSEYLDYKIESNESFYIYLLKINNLAQLEQRFNDNIVKSFLTRVVKELSVYLPFGGKVAQTNIRDTFIIYYPKTNEDEFEVGERFKALASKSFSRSGINILKTNSVALIEDIDYNEKHLADTLISSLRNLGMVTKYDDDITNGSDDFINLVTRLSEDNFNIKSVEVNKNNDPRYKEIYNEIIVNDQKIMKYLNKVPTNDQAWINLNLIENLITILYDNNIFSNITLPVLLNILEKEMFVETLEQLIIGNGFLMEQVILSIKITNITYEEKVIKNLLMLSNLGVKLSLELTNLNQENYAFVQKYNIDRLEINDELMNNEQVSELLYFAKVNNLEVIYKTSNVEQDMNTLNVSHMTGNPVDIKIINNTKKRGRK